MERSKGEEEREGKVKDRELMRDKSWKYRIEREKERKGRRLRRNKKDIKIDRQTDRQTERRMM